MRSAVAIVSAVSLLVAQMPPSFAQNALAVRAQTVALDPMQDAIDRASVSGTIVDAFKAYPKGGDLLIKRIADIIVRDPKLAVGLVKYVQTATLSKEQKQAAERGLATALQRLGIKAADLPPPSPIEAEPVFNWWIPLLGALVVAGIVCFIFCFDKDKEVTPH